MKSECCGADVKVLETGEFVEDVARGWSEIECQQCGEVAFEDEI